MRFNLAVRWTLTAGLAVLAAGCPYESKFPLDSPCKARLDEALLGDWDSTDPEDGGRITIMAFNENELLFMCDDEPDCLLMRAFTTEINGVKFLNLRQLAPPDDDLAWFFLQYRPAGEELRLRTVQDTLFTRPIKSPRALRRFLRRNLDRPELFAGDEETILRRAIPTPEATP